MTDEQASSSREGICAEADFQTRENILDSVELLRQAQIATTHLH